MQPLKVFVLAASARLTATTTRPAVDLLSANGHALLVLNSSATEAADNTSTVKLQHSDTVGGAYTDTGIAFAPVTNAAASHQVIEIDTDKLKRFVKVVNTLAGTTPAVTAAVELIAAQHATA